MSKPVIKTYSRRQPIVVYKTESKLVPSIPERLSRVRESRLNDKTLEIERFDDTFDRLAADIVIPPFKESPEQANDVRDSREIVFKVPQQATKSYGKKRKKIISDYDNNDDDTLKSLTNRNKVLSKNSKNGKSNTTKRKRQSSESNDEDESDDDWKKNKKSTFKKKKLSLTKDVEVQRFKECTVPLERFDPSTNGDVGKLSVNKNKRDKENFFEVNDDFLSVSDSNKSQNYLTSTPRFQKTKMNVSLQNISPIMLSHKLQDINNISSIKNKTSEKYKDKSVLNASNSLFSNTSMEEPNYNHINNTKPNDVELFNSDSKPLNDIKDNHTNFVDSPLLFDDTPSVSNAGNEIVINPPDKEKNLTKSIRISFDDSANSNKHQNNKKPISNHHESSYIPDDWTNDYNSSYEYFAEKSNNNKAVENNMKNNITTNINNLSDNSMDNTVKNKTSSFDKQNDDISLQNNTEYKSTISEQNDKTNEIPSFIENESNNTENNLTASNGNSILDVVERVGEKSRLSADKNQTIFNLCPKELYVLLPKLNCQIIINKEANSKVDSVEETEKSININRKSRRITKNLSIDDKVDESENDSVSEQNSNTMSRSTSSLHSDDEIEKNKKFDMDGSEFELRRNLMKMSDPVRITLRRNVRKIMDKPLEDIFEDDDMAEESYSSEQEADKNEIPTSNAKPSNAHEFLEKNTSTHEEHENSVESRENHPIFLKPGKSWARSLSIINNFQNCQNLDELAAGRGKRWTQNIQTVLDMQPDRNVRKSNDRRSNGKILYPTIVQDRYSLIPSSPTRLPRRSSIRIIPSGKRSTLTDDFFDSDRISATINKTRKTSVSRKTSLKNRRDTLIQTEGDLIKFAKDIVLKRCNQTSYVPFSDCFPDSYIKYCRKIGEGVYGEVFLYNKDDNNKSVIKIIPIEGDQLVNCEPQKKFYEILTEIIISEELHRLQLGDVHSTNGFVGVIRIMCVIGKYPEKLIDLWKLYDDEKKSENDCPSMFGDEQLYIVLELAHGGQDLESYVFQNAAESYSIFLQTAYSLAVAEKSLEFEHRDLHWGNVLISKTDETSSSFKLDNNEIKLPTKGVKVSVIDFTLSRMLYKGCKIFNDLAMDPTLFTAQGEYQFDIYRMMKDSVNNDWQQFVPYTNVLWLDYTLDKMITAARYKKKTTKIHKNAINRMKELRKTILNYKSAFDFVNSCENINL